MTEDSSPLLRVAFQSMKEIQDLAGPHHRYFQRIERRLGVSLSLKDLSIVIEGPPTEGSYARIALLYLSSQRRKGFPVDDEEIEVAIRMASATTSPSDSAEPPSENLSIPTKRRMVFPRTANQALYLKALTAHDLVFGLGPAGTGKTYLAVAVGVWMLLSGRVDRIILCRPAVEAGERLGFLPGDFREKIDPYLRPLYDALYDTLPADQVERRLANGEIEIAPLAFMRGRTLSRAFVILDEAQNTTPVQMKLFLTRLGTDSRMVITGDLTQSDLPPGTPSGLQEATHILQSIPEIGFVEFSEEDTVRHPLVGHILKAYRGLSSSPSKHDVKA